MESVNIMPLRIGFGVRVGCQCFFYLTKEGLLAELKAYLEDPDRAAQGYYNYKDNQKCAAPESYPAGRMEQMDVTAMGGRGGLTA